MIILIILIKLLNMPVSLIEKDFKERDEEAMAKERLLKHGLVRPCLLDFKKIDRQIGRLYIYLFLNLLRFYYNSEFRGHLT